MVRWIETDYFIELADTGWRPANLAGHLKWPEHARSCPYDYWVVCPACHENYIGSEGRTDEKIETSIGGNLAKSEVSAADDASSGSAESVALPLEKHGPQHGRRRWWKWF